MGSKKVVSKREKWKIALIKLIISAIIIGFIALFSLIVLVKIGVFGELPTYIELKQIKNNIATNVYSVDNKLLGRYYYQNRTNASLDQIPEHLIKALVATEDARFYEHAGLDFRSTLRVIVKTIILRDKSAGGGRTFSLVIILKPCRYLSLRLRK